MKVFLQRTVYIAALTLFVTGIALVIALVVKIIDWVISGNWLVGLIGMACVFILLFLVDNAVPPREDEASK